MNPMQNGNRQGQNPIQASKMGTQQKQSGVFFPAQMSAVPVPNVVPVPQTLMMPVPEQVQEEITASGTLFPSRPKRPR